MLPVSLVRSSFSSCSSFASIRSYSSVFLPRGIAVASAVSRDVSTFPGLSRVPASSNSSIGCSLSSLSMFPVNAPCVSFYSTKPLRGDYRIYKTKGAMVMSILRPVVVESEYSNAVRRAGGIGLTFADANPTPAGGSDKDRTYDWQNKTMIGLDINELGDLLAFASHTNGPSEIKLFHDPNLKEETQGQERKEFSIKRVAGSASSHPSYFFSLAYNNKSATPPISRRHSVSVSEGEFQVMQAVIRSLIPKLLGLHSFSHRQEFDSYSSTSQPSPRPAPSSPASSSRPPYSSTSSKSRSSLNSNNSSTASKDDDLWKS